MSYITIEQAERQGAEKAAARKRAYNPPASEQTLRDYFAAKAMQADLTGGLHEDVFDWLAARSYKMANAMLKAREA